MHWLNLSINASDSSSSGMYPFNTYQDLYLQGVISVYMIFPIM